MNFSGSLRHNEEKLNSKKQHLKQQEMGLTLFINGIIFFSSHPPPPLKY